MDFGCILVGILIGFWLDFIWISVGVWLDFDWISVGFGLDFDRIWVGFWSDPVLDHGNWPRQEVVSRYHITAAQKNQKVS